MDGVAVQSDGTILLGGNTKGAWDGTNAGSGDFFAVALSADGEELWRWQVMFDFHQCFSSQDDAVLVYS